MIKKLQLGLGKGKLDSKIRYTCAMGVDLHLDGVSVAVPVTPEEAHQERVRLEDEDDDDHDHEE